MDLLEHEESFQFTNHRTLDPPINQYILDGLYPNSLYQIWVAAKSKRGEGATTPPLAVRTEQHCKYSTVRTKIKFNFLVMLIVQAPLCTSKKYFKKKENSKHQSKSCTTKKHFFLFFIPYNFSHISTLYPLKKLHLLSKTLELLLTLSKPLLSLPPPFEWFGSLHRWENGMETSLTTKSFTCQAQFPVHVRRKKPL